MKGNHYIVSLVLLISIIGALALTASQYVNCTDLYPDEFLDLALECQYPILPIFAPYRNTHPLLLHSFKISYFRTDNHLTTFLRC